ncbi:MAG: type IV pilus modification PilV family protein [Methylomonas sp.]
MIQRHKGFSLLEILVAFAIMAVALTVVLRIFGTGVNNAVISEDYTLAVQIAESLMARIGVETPLQVGEFSGTEDDKYHWQVFIRTVAKSEADKIRNTATNDLDARESVPGLQLLQIKVSVEWGDERQPRAIELNSLRTAQLQVEQP